MDVRVERDGLGEVAIPARRYWGVKTERRRAVATPGLEPVPVELIRAFGLLKKAAARVNFTLCPDAMDEKKCAAVFAAADELIRGKLREDFPLPVWQSGAGGQTNDNVNEVIARRGNEMADEELLLPEDVNMSLLPERAFPAALHIAAALAVADELLPAAEALAKALKALGEDAAGIAARNCTALRNTLKPLFSFTPGAAPDAPARFDDTVAMETAKLAGHPFTTAAVPDDLGALMRAHGVMKSFAGDLARLAEELNSREAERISAESARELRERTAMTAIQLLGADAALGAAAACPKEERAALLPLCAHDFLQSARLLNDTISLFAARCADGGARR